MHGKLEHAERQATHIFVLVLTSDTAASRIKDSLFLNVDSADAASRTSSPKLSAANNKTQDTDTQDEEPREQVTRDKVKTSVIHI